MQMKDNFIFFCIPQECIHTCTSVIYPHIKYIMNIFKISSNIYNISYIFLASIGKIINMQCIFFCIRRSFFFHCYLFRKRFALYIFRCFVGVLFLNNLLVCFYVHFLIIFIRETFAVFAYKYSPSVSSHSR